MDCFNRGWFGKCRFAMGLVRLRPRESGFARFYYLYRLL